MSKDKKDLLFEATILIPFDDTGDLVAVRDSMQEGILKVGDELKKKHPDATDDQLSATALHIILTNWAISAIASHQKDLDYKERLKKAKERIKRAAQKVEMLKTEAQETIEQGYEQAYQMLLSAIDARDKLKEENDVLKVQVATLRKAVEMLGSKRNEE